ncbi:MAG TPA: transglycosylase SLT domain-containing protein [Bryobacteraceae bacterium]|nr:transglycosylase SLT domain-containing protein [Bryobacteraceae bacterium]
MTYFPRVVVVSLAAALLPPSFAQDLASRVKAYRDKPTVARRAQIERYASLHHNDQSGALARFALGVTCLEQKDEARAIANLESARPRLPSLDDYVLYNLATAQLAAKNAAGIPAELDRMETLSLASPLAAKAIVLKSQALVELNNPAEAIRVLRERYAELPQPDGDLTLASAYHAAADRLNAATYYQRVYFYHPDTDDAARASAALVLLKEAMGGSYPAPAGALRLERGQKWLDAHEYVQARREFQSMAAELSGLERDQARVRAGAADYLRGETALAYRYLESLDLPRSEAEAERLYYVAECQRRMNDGDDMLVTVRQLGKEYRDSPWRLKALISAGNAYLVQNRPDVYEPLYKAAYEEFPNDSSSSSCHWKVTWSAYVHRRREAADRLREQLERYTGDPRTGAALYFLGRLSEADQDFSGARAYYTKILELYPNFYYASLARARLAESKLVAVEPSAKVIRYLDTLSFPQRRAPSGNDPSPATQLRVARARLLASAGFPELAESELRFGARTDGQPHLLAIELARSAPSPHLSLRYMKTLAPDYLTTPIDEMPRRFWELLFPMPYQKDLVRNARLQNLDPYIVAALIRQESEFNPAAVSHKNAYGLTQIMPATGRQLARRNGVRRFRTSMLFQPATNLQLGARYLRSMLDECGGKWEETLASYNAGKTRVDEWLTWSSFQEGAEFVESIPFTETREYVQAVLRNAAMYRRLYASLPGGLPSTDGVTTERASTKSAHRSSKRNRS